MSKAFYRITIGLEVPSFSRGVYLQKIMFPDMGDVSKVVVDKDYSVFVLCDGTHRPPEIGSCFGRDEEHFLQILSSSNLGDMGRRIKCIAVDASRKPVCDVMCVVKNCEKIKLSQLITLLAGGARAIKSAFYRLTIGLDQLASRKGYFLGVEFTQNDGSVVKERIHGTRTVYVLCDGKCEPPNVYSVYDNADGNFLQIIDPDSRIDLGNSLKCWGVDDSWHEVPSAQCIVTCCEEMNPPQWLPVPNDKKLRITSRHDFCVRIIDRKLGEISYHTPEMEIAGDYIRAYGSKITYTGDKIVVSPIQEGDKEKYVLFIKGGRMDVKDVRTIAAEEIQVSATEQAIEIGLHEKKEYKNEPSKSTGDETTNKNWLIGSCVAACLGLLVMTLMPCILFDNVCKKYHEATAWTNEVFSASYTYTPSLVTNSLSMRTECKNVSFKDMPTNIVDTMVVSVSSTSGKPSTANDLQRPEVSGIKFYFVLCCLFYVALYGMVVFLTLRAFRALKRHNKLNGDLSGVLEALRNERDKEKRKAMQKKILDDMIDTYLDTPLSED